MTIVRIEPSGPVPLSEGPFSKEEELEDAVASYPDLIKLPGEPKFALVRQQITLPEGGILDILLVSAEGLPVVVEVKLARNPQSRREVVGQVIDYVSALTSLTVDELDSLVEGKLESAIRTLVNDSDEEFEKVWRAVGSNLRAGFARYLILVDEVPKELERIVRFLASRSNLDIGLVAVTRYRDSDGRCVLVPQHIVQANERALASTKSLGKTMSNEFAAVVNAYNASASEGFAAVGRAHNFRQIHPPEWPGRLHYEFLAGKDGIGVELHLESPEFVPIVDTVETLARKANTPFSIEWLPKWCGGPGRLVSRIPGTQSPDAIVSAMKQLIALSFDEINNALRRCSRASS